MKKNDLKKIARFIAKSKTLDIKLAKSLISSCSRRELVYFVRYLQNLLAREQIRVISQVNLSSSQKSNIKKSFSEKFVVFVTEPSASPGIKVIIGDTNFDFSINEYVDSTFERLRETYNL